MMCFPEQESKVTQLWKHNLSLNGQQKNFPLRGQVRPILLNGKLIPFLLLFVWRNRNWENKSGFIYLQVVEIPLCVGRSRLGRRQSELELAETPSWLDFVPFWCWGYLGSLILMKMILSCSSVLSFSNVSQSTLCIMSYFATIPAFAVALMAQNNVLIWDQSWERILLLWSNARYTSRGGAEINWDSWMRCV